MWLMMQNTEKKQEEITALEEHSAGLKQHKKTISGPLT